MSLKRSLRRIGSLWRSDSNLFILLFRVERNLLNCYLWIKSFKRIPSLNFFDLFRCILLNEISNVHETTANSNQQIISFLDLDVNSSMTELIDTLRFSQEQDIHSISLRIVIDKICKCFINGVWFLWNVNSLFVRTQFFNSFVQFSNFWSRWS